MQKKAAKKSCDNLLKIYYSQIKKYSLLTFEDELELSKQIQQGNNNAFQKLVNSNLRLVVRIAGSYNIPDVPVMDIIQEGNLGLMQAAKKFDYRKNVRFCVYAGLWIRRFMSRYISSKRRMIRLPLQKEEDLNKIQSAYHVLYQKMMRKPANADIAKELGFSVQYVDSIIRLAADSLPFEQNVSGIENTAVIDTHEDYTYNPERALMKQYSKDGAMRIVNKLKEREKHVIFYRYQLNGCEHHSLRKLGSKLGISPETVRRIEKLALAKFRAHANELRECICV